MAANVATYGVLGSLVASPGAASFIDDRNFYSFEYSGSHLVPAFKISIEPGPGELQFDPLNGGHVYASLGGDPEFPTFFRVHLPDGHAFVMDSSTAWFACLSERTSAQCDGYWNDDYGTGTWGSSITVTLGPGVPLPPAPEPASHALMGLGLLGLALPLRKAVGAA